MANAYTLKVYPAGMSRSVYRTIRISGSDTLDELCAAILASFDFINEHLYEFCMDNRLYSGLRFISYSEEGEPSTDIELERLDLIKGQNFLLHYDFGDDWIFTIHVQKIEDETEKHAPMLLKSKGNIEQYPD